MNARVLLIVDDTAMNRKMLIEALKGRYEFIEAAGAKEALRLLEAKTVDLMVTDIFMPEINGYELISILRNNPRFADLPIIAVTENDNASKAKAIDAGANAFINRPISNKGLQQIIDSIADKAAGDSRLLKFDFLVDSLPGALVIYKSYPDKTEIKYVSKGIKELVGWEPQEFLARSINSLEEALETGNSFLYPADAKRFLAAVDELYKTHSSTELMFRCYNKEGKVTWLWMRATYLGQEDGCPMMEALLMDVSQNTGMYQSILDQVGSFITVIDAENFELLYANIAAQRTLLSGKSGYWGAICYRSILGLQSPCPDCVIPKACYEEYRNREFTGPNGRTYSQFYKFIDWNGRKAILEYADDITEQRKLLEINTEYQAEKRANKAKSDFLSNMSHDIRTPLNAILNLTTLARGEIQQTDQLIADLDKISTAGNFLLNLVNDVLDMSRIESGHVDLTPGVYIYDEFVSYIESVIKPLCSKKDLHFTFKNLKNKKDLFIDRTRFNQVFFNLLSNAVKYTPAGGSITLELLDRELTDTTITFDAKIIDNGQGMSPEFQKKLFKPFERENNIDATSGTGLGLSITKNVIELMGGTIECTSLQGKGTTFTVHFTLPLATPQQLSTYRSSLLKQGSAADNSQLSGKRLLIVEDHPLNQEIICRLLHKHGLQTECANNGLIGVEMFKSKPQDYYNGILMDIRMPVMDGLTATKTIRQLNMPQAHSIPIIAMTANAYADDINAALEAGMNAHLSKPLEPFKLFAELKHWLGMAANNTKPLVLLVDDLEVNLAALEACINGRYNILKAHNGKEALELLGQHPNINMLITDIQMPHMDGFALIKRVRSLDKYKDLSILACTEYGDLVQQEQLLDSGVDDLVYKPIAPSVLLNRIHNVLLKHNRIV